MNDTEPPVLDGHNDVLTRLWRAGGADAAEIFLDVSPNHVDLVKARRGGLGGGFFALWVPSPPSDVPHEERMRERRHDLPLAPSMDRHEALAVVEAELAVLERLAALGALEICTTVADLERCLASGTLAAIVHLEGAEAIDPELETLDDLYARGLRSLGPVWSRPTVFGEGVPFRFPGSPDTGPGLTAAGIALVERCNALGILIDLSHLNEAGFHDVATHSRHPLVATHSNAHALCPQTRNLTDAQLRTIGETGGVVGLNFASAFLREDGRMRAATPVEIMLRHLDHLIEHVGEDGVALGSDFDGAIVPSAIGDVAGLPALRRAMRGHGYDETLLAKLCHGNWLRVLARTWADGTSVGASGRQAFEAGASG